MTKAIFATIQIMGEMGFQREPQYIQLENPLTAETYVHLGRVETIAGNDNYEAWAGRGDVTKLYFSDERGGGFTLCFGFHKGATYTWVEGVSESGPMSFEELEQLS